MNQEFPETASATSRWLWVPVVLLLCLVLAVPSSYTGGQEGIAVTTVLKLLLIPLVLCLAYTAIKWLHQSDISAVLGRTLSRKMDRDELVALWLAMLCILTAATGLLSPLLLLRKDLAPLEGEMGMDEQGQNEEQLLVDDGKDDDDGLNLSMQIRDLPMLLAIGFGCILAFTNAVSLLSLTMYKSYSAAALVHHGDLPLTYIFRRWLVIVLLGLLLLGECYLLSNTDEIIPVGRWTVLLVHSFVRTLGYLTITAGTFVLLTRLIFSDLRTIPVIVRGRNSSSNGSNQDSNRSGGNIGSGAV